MLSPINSESFDSRSNNINPEEAKPIDEEAEEAKYLLVLVKSHGAIIDNKVGIDRKVYVIECDSAENEYVVGHGYAGNKEKVARNPKTT